MKTFAQLPTYGKGLYLQLQCLMVIYAGYHIWVMLYEKRKLPLYRMLLLPVLGIINGILLVIYHHMLLLYERNDTFPEFFLSFSHVEIGKLLGISAVTLIYLVFLSLENRRYRRNTISRNSIKEALDHLPTGLCIAEESGKIQMSNFMMQKLCERITAEPLQNAQLLWEAIQAAGKETYSDYSEVKLNDGSWWAFQKTRKKLGTYRDSYSVIELSAIDITRRRSINEELKEKNQRLSIQNERMKQYGRSVEKVSREKERLLYKTRIHREMGELLLSTRHLLSSPNSPKERYHLLQRWEMQLAALLHDNENTVHQKTNNWETLKQTAKMVGLELTLTGDFSAEGTVLELMQASAAEAMTNAVKHAQATQVTMNVVKTHGMYQITFYNNGNPPDADIKPGGGLTSLKQRLETCGGTLRVQSTPVYCMTVLIPIIQKDDVI